MAETLFTPYAGATGGILIGLSAVLLMATTGRVAGASGIFARLLTTRFNEQFKWRLIFMVGLLAGAALVAPFADNARDISFRPGTALTIISGLLVGFGTALGAGCTSGHGICGLARFSVRSLVATVIFMAVAIITVLATRGMA